MNERMLLDDVTLWHDFRNGDKEAFATLMHKYYQDLFTYASRFTGYPEEIKDCLQELFLTLWKNRATLGEVAQVKYYLLASLRHRLFKSINENRSFFLYNEAYASEMSSGACTPLEYHIVEEDALNELAKKMKQVLACLTKREQEIIYLRFYESAELEEIAQIMSLNRQSVYNLLHEALKKLKRAVPHRSVFFSDIAPLLHVALIF